MESVMQYHVTPHAQNLVAAFKNKMSGLGHQAVVRLLPEGINEAVIRAAICDELKLEWGQITSKSRKRTIVHGRQFYSYFSRAFTSMTLKDIAADLNYYDHTDVIHAVNTTKDLLKTHYEPFTTHFNNIRKVLLNEVEA